jgi:hypothetical protein
MISLARACVRQETSPAHLGNIVLNCEPTDALPLLSRNANTKPHRLSRVDAESERHRANFPVTGKAIS